MTPFDQAMSNCKLILRSNETEPWPGDNPIFQAVAYGGEFKYPGLVRPLPDGSLAYLGRGAVVTATRWNPEAVCGDGIHGLPMGVGNGSRLEWPKEDGLPVVGLVLAPQGPVVAVDGEKVKTPAAQIVHAGSIFSAAQFIAANGGEGLPIVALPASTSGDYAPASTSGKKSMAIVAGTGRAQAGEAGCIAMAWWDQKADRPRMAVGYIGETKDASKKTLKPGVWYKVSNNGKFVLAGGSA